MITRDFAGGAAAVLIGAIYLYFAYGIRVSALDDTVGPGGMPRAYGWILIGLGTVLSIQAAIARARAPSRGEWTGQGRRVAWAAGLLLFGIAYILVVETLGYPISIALLIAGVALYGGAPASFRLVLIGIGGAIFLYALFAVVLGVSVPEGLIAALVS
jgi:putative tricarboxylic transport membrane protein